MRDRRLSWSSSSIRLALVVAIVAVAGVAGSLGIRGARGQEGEPAEPGEGSEHEPEAAPGLTRGNAAKTDVVVGLAGNGPDDALVVTATGRVLARAPGAAGWVQRSAGGVSVLFEQAHGAGGDVWATGAQPPAFRFRQASWDALPVRRAGAARLSACAQAALTAGRRLFVHDGRRWKELRRVPGTAALAGLCVVDASHAAVLLEGGELHTLQAGAWKPVALAGAEWLGGGSVALVATDRGELFRVDGGKLTRLVFEARLRGLRPRVAVQRGKRTWLLGAASFAGAEAAATVIVRLDGRQLALVDTLPAELGGHDWLGLLAGDDGTLLIVARDGTLARRSAAGAWSKETVEARQAAPVAHAAENPPARVGPLK